MNGITKTLAEIRAMFQPGQVWEGTRTQGGNVKVTRRMVLTVRSKDIVFKLEGEYGKRYYTPLPRSKDVIETDYGYLSYTLPKTNPPVGVALVLVSAS